MVVSKERMDEGDDLLLVENAEPHERKVVHGRRAAIGRRRPALQLERPAGTGADAAASRRPASGREGENVQRIALVLDVGNDNARRIRLVWRVERVEVQPAAFLVRVRVLLMVRLCAGE
jgi:hypothetical protein